MDDLSGEAIASQVNRIYHFRIETELFDALLSDWRFGSNERKSAGQAERRGAECPSGGDALEQATCRDADWDCQAGTFNHIQTKLKIFILEEELFQTVSINSFITHNELEDFQKNLDHSDKLNLLCAYPGLLSIISKSYPHDNSNAADGGEGTEAEPPNTYIDYVSFLENSNLL